MNLPFNAIIGRPALYRFMAISHYGYLVLKMPSPAGVLTVRGDRTAAVADLRLAMRWYPTTGARATRRHPCAPPR